ncbi:MAG: HWE histidine kinase domain-containing protein, partial [Henriciella sp.]|uniref:HWE histidine kinase domain-containing protein n=1 Tax=Henriciella sp. TaxID=1968823 RepID=UPI003C7266FA
TWSPKSDRLDWSPPVLALYGLKMPPEDRQAWFQLVHPDDVARVKAELSTVGPSGSESFSCMFRIVRPDGSVRTIIDRGTIERDAAGMATAVHGIQIDVTDEIAQDTPEHAGEDRSDSRYRTLFEAIDEGFCIVELRFDRPDHDIDYRVVEANAAFYERTGFPREILGQWLRDAAPDLEEHWYEVYGAVAKTRTPKRFEQDSDMLGRWFDVYAFPIDRPEDCRVAILFNDVSERKRHEEQARFLTHELNHRAKNLLTLVQAIARQTVASDSHDFLDRFGARLAALSSAQDVLVGRSGLNVPLAKLVHSQLAHLSDLIGDRITVSGPALALKPDKAQVLGMALHELATNAVKYGALSSAGGRIEISWSTDDRPAADPRLRMSWRETGGPPAEEPQKRGFGSIVTTTLVQRSLGGDVDVEFAPTGLVWRLSCSAEDNLIPDAAG